MERKTEKQHLVVNMIQAGFILLALFFQGIITYNDCSMYLFIAFLLLAWHYKPKYDINKTITAFACVFGCFCAFGNIYGLSAFHNVYEELTEPVIGKFALVDYRYLLIAYYPICVVGWFFVWRLILIYTLSLAEKYASGFQANEYLKNSRKLFFLTFFVGLLLWIPYYLRFYPGVLTPDSLSQMSQVLGEESWNNYNPWFHTLIINGIYEMGYLIFGSRIAGVGFFSLISMMIMALSFAWAINILYRRTGGKEVLYFLFFFYFLVPFNAMFSFTMWKDIFFSDAIFVFVVFLCEKSDRNSSWKIRDYVCFIILSCLVCLLRHNGFYAYIIAMIAMIAYKRYEWKKYAISFVICMVIVFTFNGPIMNAFNVKRVDTVNPLQAFNVPMQQIACVFYHDGNVTERQKEELNHFVDTSQLKETYQPDLSDPVAYLFLRTGDKEYINEKKLDFLRLYIEIGIRNLDYYIEGYVNQTKGYWYHNPGVYRVYSTGISEPETGLKMGLQRVILLPGKVGRIIDYIPAVFQFFYLLFWSNGAATWLMLFLLLFAIIHKSEIHMFFLPMALVLSLMLSTPVANEFRYAYAVFLSVPFLFVYTLCGNTELQRSDEITKE